MKYKTLFRLMLKAVGVMVFLQSCVPVLLYLLLVAESLLAGPEGRIPYDREPLVRLFALTGQCLAGVYLFFGGKWLVDKAIPSNRPYCPECGYDLTGSSAPRCSECGTPFRWEDVRPAASPPDGDDASDVPGR